jgi:hypothetical protein
MTANLGQNRAGNSKVHICVDKDKPKEKFAIKMVQGDNTEANALEIAKMKDEFNKLIGIDHKNIAKVYAYGKSYITKPNTRQIKNIHYLKM